MRAKLVRIGSSLGVRIPKSLLGRAGLGDLVDIEFEDGVLVIRRTDHPRAAWEELFARMASAGHDSLLDAGRHGRNAWDDSEWRWK